MYLQTLLSAFISKTLSVMLQVLLLLLLTFFLLYRDPVFPTSTHTHTHSLWSLKVSILQKRNSMPFLGRSITMRVTAANGNVYTLSELT